MKQRILAFVMCVIALGSLIGCSNQTTIKKMDNVEKTISTTKGITKNPDKNITEKTKGIKTEVGKNITSNPIIKNKV